MRDGAKRPRMARGSKRQCDLPRGEAKPCLHRDGAQASEESVAAPRLERSPGRAPRTDDQCVAGEDAQVCHKCEFLHQTQRLAFTTTTADSGSTSGVLGRKVTLGRAPSDRCSGNAKHALSAQHRPRALSRCKTAREAQKDELGAGAARDQTPHAAKQKLCSRIIMMSRFYCWLATTSERFGMRTAKKCAEAHSRAQGR